MCKKQLPTVFFPKQLEVIYDQYCSYSQVCAQTSVGYGHKSTALNITLSVGEQPGKKMIANKVLHLFHSSSLNLLRKIGTVFRYAIGCNCGTCGCGCSSWKCNCVDCGSSIDLA